MKLEQFIIFLLFNIYFFFINDCDIASVCIFIMQKETSKAYSVDLSVNSWDSFGPRKFKKGPSFIYSFIFYFFIFFFLFLHSSLQIG